MRALMDDVKIDGAGSCADENSHWTHVPDQKEEASVGVKSSRRGAVA